MQDDGAGVGVAGGGEHCRDVVVAVAAAVVEAVAEEEGLEVVDGVEDEVVAVEEDDALRVCGVRGWVPWLVFVVRLFGLGMGW